ncbi:hypothetical protein AUQ39_01380 [Lacticaseibacillus casei]|nr:hypothetical protein AUQ39_01380 [Lacticaseibacillus casei]
MSNNFNATVIRQKVELCEPLKMTIFFKIHPASQLPILAKTSTMRASRITKVVFSVQKKKKSKFQKMTIISAWVMIIITVLGVVLGALASLQLI